MRTESDCQAARVVIRVILWVTVRRGISPAPLGGFRPAAVAAEPGDGTNVHSSEELAHVVPAVAHSPEAVAYLPLDLKRCVSLLRESISDSMASRWINCTITSALTYQ